MDESVFDAWFVSAPHRKKYSRNTPAYLAAEEAWQSAIQFERERLAKLAELEYAAHRQATHLNKTGAKWMPALAAHEIRAGKIND